MTENYAKPVLKGTENSPLSLRAYRSLLLSAGLLNSPDSPCFLLLAYQLVRATPTSQFLQFLVHVTIVFQDLPHTGIGFFKFPIANFRERNQLPQPDFLGLPHNSGSEQRAVARAGTSKSTSRINSQR